MLPDQGQEIPQGAVEAFADSLCGGRRHAPKDCPARPIYLKQGQQALEAALPHLQPEGLRLSDEEIEALVDEYRSSDFRSAIAKLRAELERRRGNP